MVRWAGDDLIRRKLHSLWLMLGALCCLPYAAHAFSFGVTEVHSHLGEPLDIRVPLLLEREEHARSVFVSLAKQEVYAQWGLASYMDVSALHIQVHHEEQRIYAEITSSQPMMMALISLIIEAKQGRHHYLKQVKVFLDPPSSQAVAHIYPKHEALPSSEPLLSVPMQHITHTTPPSTLPDTSQGWARTWRYGPVRAGDSLSTIAYRLRRDKRWSNHQVMLALYRNNVDAFVQQDMNRLKSGVWLDVPRDERLRVLLSRPASEQERMHATKSQSHAVASKPEAKPKLHFVGHISAQMAGGTPHVTLSEDVALVKGRLDQLYEQSMHAGLRMDGMDATLLDMQHTVQGIEQHVAQLSKQQQSLEQYMHDWSQQSREPLPAWLWWFGGGLLLLNALGFVFLYRNISERHASLEQEGAQPSEEGDGVRIQPQTMQVRRSQQDSIDNQIYDMEQALEHQDYARAEACVEHMPEEGEHHVRVQALKVRLYHESDRISERNQYVQQQRKRLNEAQWRAFCDHLPSAVWQSLLVAGVVEGLTTISYVREDMNDEASAPQVDALETTQPSNAMEDAPLLMNEEDFFHIASPEVSLQEQEDSDADVGSFSVLEDDPEMEVEDATMMDMSFTGVDEPSMDDIPPMFEAMDETSSGVEDDIEFAWADGDEGVVASLPHADEGVASLPHADDALDFDVESLFEGEDMTIKKSSEVQEK